MTIIGLTGRKGSGKDTAANIIESIAAYHGRPTVYISFAEPLKEAVGVMFDVPHTTLFGSSTEREALVTVGSAKFTVRHALQTLGTEWGRRHLGKNIWADLGVKRAKRHLTHNPNTVVVFTDCRFTNEFEAIREAGGSIWLIERPEPKRSWFHRALDWFRRHASERAFYWPYTARSYADVRIVNDQDVAAFAACVRRLALLYTRRPSHSPLP